jgi:ATP-binding cassette subfamily F protein uup
LDEPTNDLDVETLEVLEERLAQYSGTLIVVSHDRAFLDNTVTSILTFEQDGAVHAYLGNYSEWLRRGKSLASVDSAASAERLPVENSASPRALKGGTKLSYKLQRELDGLPQVIDSVEHNLKRLREQTLDLGFYEQPYTDTQPVLDQLTDLQSELDRHLGRWAELEEMEGVLRGSR